MATGRPGDRAANNDANMIADPFARLAARPPGRPTLLTFSPFSSNISPPIISMGRGETRMAQGESRPVKKGTHVQQIDWIPPGLQKALMANHINTLSALKKRYRAGDTHQGVTNLITIYGGDSSKAIIDRIKPADIPPAVAAPANP
jgi:hypothetical protein